MKLTKLFVAEDWLVDSSRPDALAYQLDRAAHRHRNDDLHGFRKQRAVNRYVLFEILWQHQLTVPLLWSKHIFHRDSGSPKPFSEQSQRVSGNRASRVSVSLPYQGGICFLLRAPASTQVNALQ